MTNTSQTPYAAAIEHLRIDSRICAQEGESDERESCLDAIRLLEAAGKVDKAEALLVLRLLEEEWYGTSGAYGEGPDPEANEIMRPRVAIIRALLAALPDNPEKEK